MTFRQISIHALREERDQLKRVDPAGQKDFNPRAPRGARRPGSFGAGVCKCISIHALREERDKEQQEKAKKQEISIHALREERDVFNCRPFMRSHNFNPRAPRGARLRNVCDTLRRFPFQSTRSARSATTAPTMNASQTKNFNPRAPRGARLLILRHMPLTDEISIHALREERDAMLPSAYKGDFISIHALREERDLWSGKKSRARRMISIHALREERDCMIARKPQRHTNFNPRAPRGARRRRVRRTRRQAVYFNPRAPRGARLQMHPGRSI